VGARGVLQEGSSGGLSSSSGERDLIVDVSQGEEFNRRLFGDLNHDFLGPSVTTRSSSSASPMKKRRCARRRPPMLKLRHLLL
jgi:hypothetical protein